MMLTRILLKMCVFVLCENNLVNETHGGIGMISKRSEEMVGIAAQEQRDWRHSN